MVCKNSTLKMQKFHYAMWNNYTYVYFFHCNKYIIWWNYYTYIYCELNQITKNNLRKTQKN